MDPTGWAWTLLIIEVGVLEALLVHLHLPTLSQWLWRQHKHHWWSRWVTLGILSLLVVHLVWGWIGGPAHPASPAVDTTCADDSVPQ